MVFSCNIFRIKTMRSTVTIKHEQYGLRIRLDEKEPWDALLSEIRQKFRASANFFEDAALTLTFTGRHLSEEEEDEVIAIIEEETRIRIVCVFSEDPQRCEPFLRARDLVYAQCMQRIEEAKAHQAVTDETQPIRLHKSQLSGYAEGFAEGAAEVVSTASNNKYQMLLRSLHAGEIYKTDRTVIVIGNIEEGAALTTSRDAIILGSIRGVVRAGEEGKGQHFVASSGFRPRKLSIDGVVSRTQQRLFSRPIGGLAAVKDHEICIVPFDQDMESLFRGASAQNAESSAVSLEDSSDLPDSDQRDSGKGSSAEEK